MWQCYSTAAYWSSTVTTPNIYFKLLGDSDKIFLLKFLNFHTKGLYLSANFIYVLNIRDYLNLWPGPFRSTHEIMLSHSMNGSFQVGSTNNGCGGSRNVGCTLVDSCALLNLTINMCWWFLIHPPIIIVCQIPVDPAGGHCYWDSIKPCESRGFGPRLTAQ